MKAELIRSVEARFGVTFPDDWKAWSPETERETVRGVAELLHPDAYLLGNAGEIVIGTTSDVEELAFLPSKGKPGVLRGGVYVLGARKPKKVVEKFTDLVLRAPRRQRPDEILYAKRMAWAGYLCGEVPTCPGSAEDAARAREELPDLFAAAELVRPLAQAHPWIANAYEVLALETARARKTPAADVIQRWVDRGLDRATLPAAELQRFLAGDGEAKN